MDKFLDYNNCKDASEISLCILKSWHSDLQMNTNYFKPNILKWAMDLEKNVYVKDTYGSIHFTLSYFMKNRSKKEKKDLFDKVKEALDISK